MAVLTEDDDQALFRVRQARMYRNYSKSVKPILKFAPAGKLVAARTRDGAEVFNAPVDHVS